MFGRDNYMGFYWSERKLSVSDYVNYVGGVIAGINGVVGGLNGVKLTSHRKSLNIDLKNYSERESEIANLVMDPELAYTTEYCPIRGKLLFTQVGFTSFWELEIPNELPMIVSICDGGFGGSRTLSSMVCYVDIKNKILLKTIWLFLIEFCKPDFAKYTSSDLDFRIDPDFEYNHSLGWLSFFNCPVQVHGTSDDIEVDANRDVTFISVSDKKIGTLNDEVVDLVASAQNYLVNKGFLFKR